MINKKSAAFSSAHLIGAEKQRGDARQGKAVTRPGINGSTTGDGMQRKAWIIGLKPEKIDEYKRLHAEVWPRVLEMIQICNIRNYAIFLREPENLLFGVYEYHGDDFDADMARMASDPVTQDWWALTEPCQAPLASKADGEWWSPMEQVFYQA